MCLGKFYFEACIGIYIGFVVVGVVGVNKFVYDIWGDMVNIVFCMEINGQVGWVNILEVIYNLIKYQFDCEYWGKVQVKNKGLIDMYFVKGACVGVIVFVQCEIFERFRLVWDVVVLVVVIFWFVGKWLANLYNFLAENVVFVFVIICIFNLEFLKLNVIMRIKLFLAVLVFIVLFLAVLFVQ